MTTWVDGTGLLHALAVVAMAAGVAGCCGGGPSHTCTAAIEYAGGKYSSRGGGSSEAAARHDAEAGVCLAYCQNGDLVVDEAWKKWKATADGQKSKAGKPFDIGFQPSLKVLYDRCTARCNADIVAKKTTVTTTCQE